MLVSGSSLGMRFGAEEIFDDVSFTVNRGERSALVGVNGAGKTTLIRLMTGELEPTSGDLHVSAGTRIAHLPQQMGVFPRGPLLEAVCREAGEAARALRRMRSVQADLETASEQGRKRELLQELADEALGRDLLHALRENQDPVPACGLGQDGGLGLRQIDARHNSALQGSTGLPVTTLAPQSAAAGGASTFG